MTQPRVGEYWYINTPGVRTIFGKIVSVSDTTIVAYIPEFKKVVSYSTLITDKDVKWEPNWFFRILGYK
jgi:hypothetical protein